MSTALEKLESLGKGINGLDRETATDIVASLDVGPDEARRLINRLTSRTIGYTCDLRTAVKNGDLDAVKYIIEHGANIHVDNDYALREASERGYFDIVKYLLSQGADVNIRDSIVLRTAVKKGHLDIVKYLVEQGVDIQYDVNDALQLAMSYGHLDTGLYLIEHGADIQACTDFTVERAAEGDI